MAKRMTSRKKTVMQDVHPDVVDRIENFTDPDRIEAARARLVDYSKVAEQFAASTDLPDDDEDADGLMNVIPAASPATPAAAASAADDLDLLASLEQQQEQSSLPSSPVLTDMDDDMADDDSVNLDAFLADSEPPAVAAEPIRADDDHLDDFDISDLDTDLMDDSRGVVGKAGDSAFGAINEDEDDDIFGVGIPSAVQEPTPYGNKSSNKAEDDYEFPFDDDIGDETSSVKERAVPTWMVEDDDDADAPDVLSALNRRAAEADGDAEVGMFDEPEVVDEQMSAARKTVRVPASAASLDDVLGLDDEEDEDRTVKLSSSDAIDDEPVSSNVSEGQDTAVIVEETVKKKRSFLPAFGRRKKSNVRVHEVPAAPINRDESAHAGDVTAQEVSNTKAVKSGKGGLFGKKKVIKQDVIVEQSVLGDDKQTVASVVEADSDGDAAVVKGTSIRKKRNPLLRLAASVVAIAAILGGGYYAANMMGFIPQPSKPQAVTPLAKNVAPAATVPETSVPNLDDAVKSDAPNTASVVGKPEVVKSPDGSTVTTMTVPLAEAPTVGQATNQSGTGVLTLPDLGDDDPEPTVIKTEIKTTQGNADAAVATTETVDTADVDILDDLYSAGKSESDLAAVDEAVTLDRVLELSELLEEQKKSLDSALERLRTMETIVAEKDAAIAAVQSEASEAQSAANQARDMAMAQNNVLIEVVGIQDKMKIAEELIVDLSERTAAIESDNSDVQQIEYLNERIKELTKHMALLSRTVVSNARNLDDARDAQASAERAHAEAQAAVDAQAQATMDEQTQPAPAGTAGVYGNEKRLMTTPTLQDEVEIPADVKVGDELPVYGKVLDISPTEDGGKLVVMENSSKIVPRQE